MNKTNLIGIGLIAALFMLMTWYNAPSEEEQARQQKQERITRDSLMRVDSIKTAQSNQTTAPIATETLPDSLKSKILGEEANRLGQFQPAASVNNEDFVLENDKIKFIIGARGAKIKRIEMKGQKAYTLRDTFKLEALTELILLNDAKNKFEYLIPLANGNQISTAQLAFSSDQNSNKNTLILKAPNAQGGYIEQRFSLNPENPYLLDYTIGFVGLNNVIKPGINSISLNWENYLTPFERNMAYEQTMSSVYYKLDQESPNYCSCRADDNINLENPVKWVSGVQQFYNTTLIAADKSFKSAKAETIMLPADNKEGDLKLLKTRVDIPFGGTANETFKMKLFAGPNDFSLLRQQNVELENIIPYGWSVFGSINRWVVRPVFNALNGLLGSLGLTIILLTLLIKTLLLPLQYKMILSSVKTNLLKPQLNKIKERLGDNQSAFAQEQMKLYSQAGVNPMGGCLPAFAQMPIWIALYRFFPSAFDFRQQGFLWSNDLVNYDSVVYFGFNLPFIGSHISLFTVLWVISMIAYAWYNSKLMDTTMMQQNPMLIYMPYIFPVIFFFALNSYSSGLTCYMLFSNIFNILFTVLCKNVFINEDKVRLVLEENMKNPNKPKSKFQQKLEEAMKQQQEIQQQKKNK